MKRHQLIGPALTTALIFAVPFIQGVSAEHYPPAGDTRAALVARSKVWMPTDIPSMDLRVGPAGTGSFEPGATVTCDYVDRKLSGSSPKFACRLPDGHELKVKYGAGNGEVYGEVAATRLLWALGFGADRMYAVRVVCRGCPDKISALVDDNGNRVVDPAAIERKFSGRELADGWNWEELHLVDERAGGATRAERDAFKLLAVFFQHTDSKSKNQRIVCFEEGGEGIDCNVPLMMIQDLGLTFGRANALNQQHRASVNLTEWQATPVWKGTRGCVGNLPPSWTGTLQNPVIGEEGRQFLADLLIQLSDEQIRDMFETARVHLRLRAPNDGRTGFATVDEWVVAFKQKRTQIVERRCESD